MFLALLFLALTIGLSSTFVLAIADYDESYTVLIPSSHYAQIGEGNFAAGVIRAGTGGGINGRGGDGFLANPASYWSGIPNNNTGVVGAGRKTYFRLEIPDHIDPLTVSTLQLHLTIRDTHNQAPFSVSLFSLDHPLPTNLRGYNGIYGANAVPIKARYPGRAHVATSNLITTTAANGLPLFFDLSDYFWENPESILELAMLADSQMIGVFDSTGSVNQRPQFTLVVNEPIRRLFAHDRVGEVSMTFDATESTFTGTTQDDSARLSVVSGLRDYQSITIGGFQVSSSTKTEPIPLNFGLNLIPVTVTKGDGSLVNFTVELTREDPRVPLNEELDAFTPRINYLLADIDRRGGTLVVDNDNPINTLVYLNHLIQDTRSLIEGVTSPTDEVLEIIQGNFIIIDRIIGYRLRRTFDYDTFFGTDGFHRFNYHFRAYGALPPGGQAAVPMNDWRDNNGRLIQSHGGQVQPLNGYWKTNTATVGVGTIIVPADETTGTDDWWIWIGEDKTRSARPIDGMTAYVSRDLLNWICMGVIFHVHDMLPVRSTHVEGVADAAHGVDGSNFIWDLVGGGTASSPNITGPTDETRTFWGFELHLDNLALLKEWSEMNGPGTDSHGNMVSQDDIHQAYHFLLAYRRQDNPNEFYMDHLLLAFENLYSHYNIVERPKMLFNEEAQQYVIVFHADGPSDLNISRWLREVEDQEQILRMNSSRYTRALIGFAVSDSPFGPFRLVNVSRGNWLQSTMNTIGGNNHALNIQRQGESRDMTAFTTTGNLLDHRGNPVLEGDQPVQGQVAYVVYSSEMNAQTYISRLAPCFTRLSAPQIPFISRDNNLNTHYADELVHGRHFQQRVFSGVPAQEAQAVFHFDGTYYMVNSGTHGWGVFGPAARHFNFRSNNILSSWQYIGNPVIPGSDTRLGATFGMQSTYVFPYDKENGLFIFMGNRWLVDDAPNAPVDPSPLPSGGSASPWSNHIWIPVQFDPDRGNFNILNLSDWTLEDLRLLGRAPLALPQVIAITCQDTLPDFIDMEGVDIAVTWGSAAIRDAINYDYFIPFAALGIITETGRNFSVQIMRIPTNTVYYIDAIGPNVLYAVGGSTIFFDGVSATIGDRLLNNLPDQVSTGFIWGHGSISDSRGVANVGNSVWTYGHWSNEDADWNVTYYLPLPAGTHRITSGHQEWWNAPTRTLSATIQLGTNESEILLTPSSITFPAGAANQWMTGTFTGEFTLTEDTVVIYRVHSINRPQTNAQGALLSWLAVDTLQEGHGRDPALQAAILYAQALSFREFTRASWAMMQSELLVAIAIADEINSSPTDIENITGRLWAAIDNLVPIDSTPTLNWNALEDAIAQGQYRESLGQGNIPRAQWTNFRSTLGLAISLRNNPNATQIEIDSATTTLTTILGELSN